ncbi:hypothetical protein RZP91_03205 [Citrobacter freundii]|uniref:hypothetical protein n=1 Tax=Citrobacter freundii TaxID=546 RepID=UPI00292A7BCA|nr:hypothetical protein [Citrobacter freundii]MEB0335727.1 hypothetical protein [Citrobacter freundii]
MTSREKFEAWYLENWGHTEDDHETMFERDPDSNEEYYRLGVRMAHGAWKASELASQQKLIDMAVQLANAESKCRELAAENAALKNPDNWLSQSDYGYEAAEVATQNGATEDESLRAGMVAIINRIEAPATDAFLAEVRASAIPEGYVLVPQQIFLDPSDIESICSQCGDGHESGYGDFTDGLLWVGNIQRDDGSIVHGLHISSADYTEEGGVTVCEFYAQLRKGDAL